MRICIFMILMAAMALAGTAQSQQIIDLYSGIDSSDVTITGDVDGHSLRLDLIFKGKVLESHEMSLDGPGVWVTQWYPRDPEKGSYDVCATLSKGNDTATKKCKSFFYGGVEPIRFDVRDFYADSRGLHLAISSGDPTIVDIYYMLIQGNKAVYVTREQAVSIEGSLASTLQKDYVWRQILKNDQEYKGRVRIVELNHKQTRSFMNSFRAKEDALITETYQDETGASATVKGNSRVPFEGYLQFTLSQKDVTINTTMKKTPVLLTDDDETVEISWNKTLDPGIYELRTVLIGQDGDVLDLEENVIESKPMARSNSTQTDNKAPLSGAFAAASMLAMAIIMKRKIGSR